MPWPVFSLRLALLLLSTSFGLPGISAEGNVGCLFSERLCLEEEWCYDDLAFGRCLPRTGDLEEDDLFRYTLEREALHELSSELRRLFALGYRWSHGYTQCRLQAMLYAFKNDLIFEPNTCSHLSDNDLEGALRALEGQVEIDPREIAIIKYTPSVEDPHAKYADEVFYPPIRNQVQEEKILAPNAIDLDLPDPYAENAVVKRARVPQLHRRSAPLPDILPIGPEDVDPRDTLQFLQNYDNDNSINNDQDDISEMYPIVKFLDDMQLSPIEIRDILNSDNREKLDELLGRLDYNSQSVPLEDLEDSLTEKGTDDDEPLERFTLNYNTPDNFRKGWTSRDSIKEDNEDDFPESRVYSDEGDLNENYEPREYGSGQDLYPGKELEAATDSQIFRELSMQMKNGRKQIHPAVYAEGGVVWSEPIDNMEGVAQEEANPLMSLDQLLLNYNMGFKRPERLDVKKPGPPFDAQITDNSYKDVEETKLKPEKKHKRQRFSELRDDGQGYIRITFKNPLKHRSQGLLVIASIRNILKLDPSQITGTFSVPTQSVILRTNPVKNDIITVMDTPDFKAEIEKMTGMTINSIKYVEASGWDNNKDEIRDDIILPSMMKKEPKNIHSHMAAEYDPSKFEDSQQDYVYLSFKKGFTAWKQGSRVIQNISDLLHLEPGAFADGRVNPKSVIFRVKPNSRGLNASDVAKKIELVKDKLEGVEIISVGVGDKENMQTVISVPLGNNDQFYIVIFMVCGVLLAMIIATALLIVIRRHLKSREKLQGLTRPETEASKDYQDLCRARMAAKPQPVSDTVHGRITSLSRESEQSPSSRSSTSSWSEEPALHNMDISTGHMVLTYMEDHLKNKDRLEQEWIALCAYVAEPCETSVAQKQVNKDKNRYPEIVPYDHARVVLNELSNANASDYINASSITDHDPRNPAYIATQGPLPHTAPDFWQLIWEQGAVVIVMLTRLTEGGTAMCHRYWPEEGSELYHIYEVHLVSEHIWCDDYLVRSFYLKNIRTGETRTVTQFHFLSWPDSGVPSSTKALLEFRRKVNKSYRGRSCPIVVHCSDGAGRSGTYCLIDMVLSRMAKGAKEIDIAATLEHLRDQRPKMVATKQQFEFVLTAVAEEVHAILKALPAQPQPATSQEKDK